MPKLAPKQPNPLDEQQAVLTYLHNKPKQHLIIPGIEPTNFNAVAVEQILKDCRTTPEVIQQLISLKELTVIDLIPIHLKTDRHDRVVTAGPNSFYVPPIGQDYVALTVQSSQNDNNPLVASQFSG